MFINFRTSDEQASAALIDRELSYRFGSEQIFRAEKSVPAGADIDTVIIQGVRRSRALVAVIGQRWLVTGDGRRPLDDPNDWTRRELVEAYHFDVPVIPVLVGQIPYLRARDLPAELGWLPSCKYLRLNYRDVESGIERLAQALVERIPELGQRTTAEPAEPTGAAAPSGGIGSTTVNGSGNTTVGGIGNRTAVTTFNDQVDARYGNFGITG